jgi:SAM-dependent methyltransferase
VELARYLLGDGIEIGPGHSPFPIPFPGVRIRYVDRWEPDQNRALFPELGRAEFPEPDIVANLDTDRLSALQNSSQDFVIASHVLEHMANPLALLGEISRVLRPGGIALVLMPDRTRTYDRNRAATPLAHLVGEYESDVTSVSDDHIEDFLRGVGEWVEGSDVAERVRQFETHRQRSFHVHCWDQSEFFDVLKFTVSDMGLRWELLDALFVQDVEDSIEFGYALRKPTVSTEGSECLERIDAVWKMLGQRAWDRANQNEELRQLTGRDHVAGGTTPSADLRRAGKALTDALRHSRLAPALRAVRRGGRQLRGRLLSTEPNR